MTKIKTVLGEIPREELGITATHEHVLMNASAYYNTPVDISKKKLSMQKVNLTNLGFIRRNIFDIKDNLILNDVNIAIDEILEFKKAGGKTIIDATCSGLGRDPCSLKIISKKTDINIVIGCGFYIERFHPPYISYNSINEITEEIVSEINEGIKGTDILPGIIGEIGTSEYITKNEEKVLRAAAQAHLKTNLSIIVHPYPWGSTGMKILDILQQENVPLNRVIMSHVDCSMNLEYQKSIADRGAYIEYDNFGKEYYMDKDLSQNPRDTERIEALSKLISDGFTKNILFSTDVCMKIDLHRYGGWGYDHILSNILPRLRKIGISEETIHEILVVNPRKALTGEE